MRKSATTPATDAALAAAPKPSAKAPVADIAEIRAAIHALMNKNARIVYLVGGFPVRCVGTLTTGCLKTEKEVLLVDVRPSEGSTVRGTTSMLLPVSWIESVGAA